MRCFLAIDFPGKVKKELERIQKQIPVDLAKIKFVEPENLHLTLKFFGEISDVKVNKMKQLLSNAKFKSFDASLGITGFFPSSSYIHVIWVSLEPVEKIKELSKEINNLLKSRDERFESHVTLGRVKFVKDKKTFVEKIKKIKVESMKFAVDSFSLKKSTLNEKGPVYEIIKKYILFQ